MRETGEEVNASAGTGIETEEVDANAGTGIETEEVDANAGTGIKSGEVDAGAGTGIEIEVPSDVAHLPFVRAVVSAAARLEFSLNEDRVYDLALVVTEATTNAIQAQQSAGVTQPVRIWCRAAENAVTVAIQDHGTGFDPDSLPVLPPPESPERLNHEKGLGISLIRLLADESEIRSSPEGTEVRVVLRTSESRPADGSANRKAVQFGDSSPVPQRE